MNSTPPIATTMDKKAAMQDIIARVGKERAIDMVMKAYDTELMTTLMNRLEEGKSKMIGGYKRRDHLEAALRRVLEVCELAKV
jgi:hypothetical protein